MPQFLLIDHSLSGPGSHHYEYATHLLHAATAEGLRTVLGCNRRWQSPEGLPSGCVCHAVFPHSTYGGNSLTKEAMNATEPPGNRNWKDRWPRTGRSIRDRYNRWRYQRRHESRLSLFTEALLEFFRRAPLSAGDQVFLPTLSDFDLLALSRVLPAVPNAMEVDWHLQFHFSFLEGREPDYARQRGRLEAMRARFSSALKPLRQFRLHFYSTTAQMAAQYNQLEQGRFEWLPYPINPAFLPRSQKNGSQPLRIVCAGGLRDEKGKAAAPRIIESLWPDLLSSGVAQLIFQGGSADLQSLTRRSWATATNEQIASGDWPTAPLVQAPFPLSIEGYAGLIRNADVGLFLYDSYRYYGRCSGVLVEMLCCGVPVVVPGGCWLHDEITAPQQEYHRRNAMKTTRQWEQVAASGRYAPRRSIRVEVPPGARTVLMEITPAVCGGPRRYLGCELRWRDRNKESRKIATEIVAPSGRDEPSRLIAALPAGEGELELQLWNAYENRPLSLPTVELGFSESALPANAVGAVFASDLDVADAVREITRHWDHYRHTALEYSELYRPLHQPSQAVRQLLKRSAQAARAA